MKKFSYFFILYILLIALVLNFYVNVLNSSKSALDSTNSKLVGIKYLTDLDNLSISTIEYLFEHSNDEKDLIIANIKSIHQLHDTHPKFYNETLIIHFKFIEEFNPDYHDINYYNFFDYINHENYIVGNKAEILFSKNKEQYFLGTLLTHYIPEFLISAGILRNISNDISKFSSMNREKKDTYLEYKKLANLSAKELNEIIKLLDKFNDTKELSDIIIGIDYSLEKLTNLESTDTALISATHQLFNYAKKLSVKNRELLTHLLENDLEHIESKMLYYRIILLFLILLITTIMYYFYRIFNAYIKKDAELTSLNKSLLEKIQSEVLTSRKKDQRMIEQSRLAQMGEMISMIAHQWRQPLAAIASTSASLELKAQLDKLDKETIIDLSRDISSYTQHLSSTINDFRNFFKADKEVAETSFKEMVKSIIGIVDSTLKNKGITLNQQFDSDEKFCLLPNEIKQVILNLIKNAEDALIENDIENPCISIRAYSTKEANILTISDNAGGIPYDIINKIFNPYFSTKLNKNGTGLGLYMSKIIVEEHCGGSLIVSNNLDGAVFKLYIKKGINNEY